MVICDALRNTNNTGINHWILWYGYMQKASIHKVWLFEVCDCNPFIEKTLRLFPWPSEVRRSMKSLENLNSLVLSMINSTTNILAIVRLAYGFVKLNRSLVYALATVFYIFKLILKKELGILQQKFYFSLHPSGFCRLGLDEFYSPKLKNSVLNKDEHPSVMNKQTSKRN